MVLGVFVGLFLNFFVSDPFIKKIILIDNVFYLGGNGFIRLMKMLVVPLVFFSIVVGVASISDVKKIGTIGGSTILIYLVTTAIAIILALFISGLIQLGVGLKLGAVKTANVTMNNTMPNSILNIIPENPFNALANGDMLPVIIFGLLVGIILTKLREETQVVNKIFQEGNRIMMEMTNIVMKFAPIGVFCLMAKTFAGLGAEGVLPLGKYVSCVLIGLALQAFVVYPSLLVIFTRLNPFISLKDSIQ